MSAQWILSVVALSAYVGFVAGVVVSRVAFEVGRRRNGVLDDSVFRGGGSR